MISLEYLEKSRKNFGLTWENILEIVHTLEYIAEDNQKKETEDFLLEIEKFCCKKIIENIYCNKE